MAVIYDKDRIIEDSDGLSVAHALGIEIRRAGKTYQLRCPGHQDRLGKPDRNFGNAWITKHGYFCAACDKAVNTVSMAMEVRDFSYREALEFVADCNGGRDLYIDEEKTRETEEENLCEEKCSTGNSGSNMPKCITWEEMRMIGLNPSYDKNHHPLGSFENDPKWMAEFSVLGSYYNLLVRYNRTLSDLSDDEKRIWKSLAPEAKEKATVNPVRKKLFDQEKEIVKFYNSLTPVQKMVWQREYVNGTIRSFILSCQKATAFLSQEKTESVLTSCLTDNGWLNEYLVCSQNKEGLPVLYKQFPKEYLRLVVRKCKSSKAKYTKMLQSVSDCTDAFNVSLYYILKDWIKQIDTILLEHEDALNN